MKESFYFPHDYEPTSDPKVQALIGEFGAEGYGIFWRLVEMLHSSEDHRIPNKAYIFIAIAKQMSTSAERIISIVDYSIKVCELFIRDENYIWSERVNRNIEKRTEISNKRSEAGKSGANAKQMQANAKQMQANAKQMQAIVQQNEAKESKVNESKGEEIKVKESKVNENIISSTKVEDSAPPSPDEKSKLHSEFIGYYVSWYLDKVGVIYKFSDATDGKAVKQMITYIRKAQKEKTGTEPIDIEIMNGWKFILGKYDKWDLFYQSQLKLSQINGNLVNIMANIKGISKNGKSTEFRIGESLSAVDQAFERNRERNKTK